MTTERMTRGAKKAMREKLQGKREKGRQRKRWINNIPNDLVELEIANWEQKTKNRK